MSHTRTATSSRVWGGVLAAILSVVAAISLIVVPPAAHASSSDPSGTNTVTYWAANPDVRPYEVVQYTKNLDELYTYYSTTDTKGKRMLSAASVDALLAQSETFYKLYQADPSNETAWSGPMTWLFSFGNKQINSISERLATVFVTKWKNDAKAAVTGKLDQYIADLQAAKDAAPENADRIDKLIENLNTYKNDPNFDPTNPDVAASIAAATALKEDSHATPEVPGYVEQPADPKADAAAALQAEADKLRALIAANGTDTGNLTADQLAAAQQALAKADNALKDLDKQTAESLSALTDEVKNATSTAQGQIDTNKQEALAALKALRQTADALAANTNVPEDKRTPLTEDTTKADAIEADLANHTVAEIKALTEKTQADIDAARKAVAEANLDEVIAKLQALVDNNGEGTKNLTPEQLTAAQQALAKADDALKDLDKQTAESLSALTDEVKNATSTAQGQIDTNKQEALAALKALRQTADALAANTNVPEDKRTPLTEDTTKADAIEADLANHTVAEIKALTEKTQADIDAARKAITEANLDEVIAKLQTLVDNNGEGTKNLTSGQLADAREALADAKGAKANAANKTANELQAVANTAEAAFNMASEQVTANKKTARDALNAAIGEANTLAGDINLPADAKTALDAAIEDAQSVASNQDATVKQLEEAKTTLDQAIATATRARDNALKDSALADLDKQIAALEKVLRDNPAASQNLTSEERQAAENALQTAKAVKQAAKDKSLQDIEDATAAAREAATKAATQVSANLNNAKTELDNEIKNATALLNYDGRSALDPQEKAALKSAIDAATGVRAQEPVTVAELKNALNNLRDAKNTAMNEMKVRAKAALEDAINNLKSTLDANPEDSENLTDEQRKEATDKLNDLKAKLNKADDEGTTFEGINGWTADALSTTSTVNQQVAANKQQPITDLQNKIAELEEFLAAHPEATEDLKDAESKAAKKALEDAKKALTDAQAGTMSVKDIKDATAAAGTALTDAKDEVTENRVASREKLDAALAKAKALLERDDLTPDTRKALQDAVSAGTLGESATVAQMDEATDALNAAIKQAAVDDLDKQIAALNQVLTDNPAESKNLTADQRAEAEKALADAQDVKAAAADKSADEINQAADGAKRAVSAARAAVSANKAAAKQNLDAEITNAKAVSDSDIPAEAKQKLDEAIAAAKIVSDNRASTVADMERALSTLRAAKDEAAKAGSDAKKAATDSLSNAVKALEEALKANPEESKNLSEQERAAAEQALETAKAALEGAEGSKTADVQAAANAALDALNTLNNNVAANKVEPTKELAKSVQALEDFLAAHPAEGKDLTDAQRAAADKALAAAKKALADAEAGTLSVADIEAAAKAADEAAAAGAKAVEDNRAAARAAYEKALAKAKELLARTDLTEASRKALQAVVDGSSLAEDATVADIEVATKALTDAIDAVEYVKPSLARTGATLAALPLALALVAGGVLLVRRRRQEA